MFKDNLYRIFGQKSSKIFSISDSTSREPPHRNRVIKLLIKRHPKESKETFNTGFSTDNLLSYLFTTGDYRIPKPAETRPDGSRIDISTYLPHKGIIRSENGDNKCAWNNNWNAYKCSDMEHHMAIIESLDKDTETRRLSPVAILGKPIFGTSRNDSSKYQATPLLTWNFF